MTIHTVYAVKRIYMDTITCILFIAVSHYTAIASYAVDIKPVSHGPTYTV